ncbi:Bax inhibitor-1/YccA family protein [Pontiellaceae bacterium B12219]|nr:Bax inhibitor-1/YccA family protein [Pontiellaceae bacterium B12219]
MHGAYAKNVRIFNVCAHTSKSLSILCEAHAFTFARKNKMNILATLGSIASIVAILIQVKDKFHEKKELRDRIIYLTYGFTAGSLLGVLNKTEITIADPVSISSLAIIIALIAFAVVLFIIAIGFIKNTDSDKNEGFLGTGSGVAVIILMLLVVLGFSTKKHEPRVENTVTYGEYRILVDQLRSDGQYERALELLEKARNLLEEPDIRIDHSRKVGLEIYNELLVSEGIPPVTEEEMIKRFEDYMLSKGMKVEAQISGANQQVEPTLTTPVGMSNEQSSAAHP